jgi:hypothetical protein
MERSEFGKMWEDFIKITLAGYPPDAVARAQVIFYSGAIVCIIATRRVIDKSKGDAKRALKDLNLIHEEISGFLFDEVEQHLGQPAGSNLVH